jgi:cellobiose dehydrogenase (acceptor)
VLPTALGQTNSPTTFTDAGSGITFNSWSIANGGSQTQGGYTFGVALPSTALTTDATEFIGYLVCLGNPFRANIAQSQI